MFADAARYGRTGEASDPPTSSDTLQLRRMPFQLWDEVMT